MLVTIYTDGGIRNGHCVFAFVARSKYGWLKGLGELPVTKHIEQVEFAALPAAANMVIKNWPETKVLFYNVDNLAVVHTMWHVAGYGDRKPNKNIVEKCDTFYKKAVARDIIIRTKHVKGHTSKQGIRGYMNQMVDDLVRQNYK